ncbi:DUF86 domain-containing protein [Bacteroidia bacterium]|nr:DUF86 domain-containing protein [Bacteroidia bacterium]
MYSKLLIKEALHNIEQILQELQEWTSHITCGDDFALSHDGMVLLNAVCMKFIVLGEEVKSIDKRTNKMLLPLYPSVDWQAIMKLRDKTVHHYFDIDADKIAEILLNDIPYVLPVIRQMQNDLCNPDETECSVI